jgi:ribose transport system substrate-binding protein
MDMRRGRTVRAMLLGVAVALLVAACGSSSSSSSSASGGSASTASGSQGSSGLAQAQANVNAHKNAPTKIGPTVPIGKPIPKGKTVVFVNCGAEACTETAAALQSALSTIGWKFQQLVAQPTPQSVQAAMAEALRRHPDFIASSGVSASQFPEQLKAINAAHIPYVTKFANENTGQDGTTYNAVEPSRINVGTALLADRTVVDMGGKGTIGVFYLTGFPLPKEYTDAYVAEVKKVCPSCKILSTNVPPTAIGTTSGQIICNFVRANPEANHIMVGYDALLLGMPAACKGASVPLPKAYSFSPDAPGIQALNAGQTVAALPQYQNEDGWNMVDAMIRIATGGKVADSQPYPPWYLWDKTNVPKSGTPYPAIIPNYQAQYKKLWGIQ